MESWKKRWRFVERLGSGGQGTVDKVLDRRALLPEMAKSQSLAQSGVPPSWDSVSNINLFDQALDRHLNEHPEARADPGVHGALKIYTIPPDSARRVSAEQRMRREIEVLDEVANPALIRLLEANVEGHWLVTEYLPGGRLADDVNMRRFRGRLLDALEALLPIIAAVADLQSRRIMHRDVKPENIFLRSDGSLVLGDFGIVFLGDDEAPRMSATDEKVGSRAWMPAWAEGGRIDDYDPTFDVYSLAKVLWSMVAGKPVLPREYHHEPEHELERLFPERPEIGFARFLLDPFIVERKDQAMGTAVTMLELIKRYLPAIRRGGRPVDERSIGLCVLCGTGEYRRLPEERYVLVPRRDDPPQGPFWLQAGDQWVKRNNYIPAHAWICNACGHIQLFVPRGRFPDVLPR